MMKEKNEQSKAFFSILEKIQLEAVKKASNFVIKHTRKPKKITISFKDQIKWL